MMLKIFLVEDEKLIREGIKNGISWEEEGYEFVGDASDGELAYPMIQKLQPDILITDIRMPFMNGLELSQLVKREFPNIKIIILSGYNEFDYAKQAIQIGITDYLLKPISSAQLLEAINRIGESIYKERDKNEILKRYKQEMEENNHVERQKMLSSILTGNMSMTEIIEKSKVLNMNLASQYLNVIIFKEFCSDPDNKEEILQLSQASEEVKNSMEDISEVLVFERDENVWVFIVKGESEDEVRNRTEEIKDKALSIMEKYPKLSFFGGIGSTIQRLTDLSKSYSQANKAFSSRFFVPHKKIVTVEEAEQSVLFSNQELPNVKDIHLSPVKKETVETFIRDGSSAEVEHFIEEYFDGLGDAAQNSLMFRQYIVMDIYFAGINYIKELGINLDELPIEYQKNSDISGYITTIEHTKSYLKDLFTSIISIRENCVYRKNSTLIRKAKEFIDKNFTNPNISLKSVSDYVSISSCYFSSIFSQEMNVTFIEYLTKARMDEAKRLLQGTIKRSSEIAAEVGYLDSHYFSFLFKKTQGCTPSEYRKRGAEA